MRPTRALRNTAAIGAATFIALVGSSGLASASGAKPILIGGIGGSTGAYGTTGIATDDGAQLAVDQLDAKGGLLGRKVTFTFYNDGASATVSAQRFKEFVSDGAVAVDGSPDTGPTTAALADQYKLPIVGVDDDAGLTIYPNGPSKPPLPWVWATSLNTFAYGNALAHYALNHWSSCNGLALLHDPESYGDGGEAGILQVLTPAGKKLAVDDAITEDWSTGATVGLESEISKIKSSGAHCVVVWLTPQDAATFMETMHTMGDNFTVLGNDEMDSDPTFSNLARKAGNGAMAPIMTAVLHPSAALTSFDKTYQAKFHVAATEFSYASYDGIMILAKAIEMAHTTDNIAVQKALNHLTGFQTLMGVVNFSPQNHATVTTAQLTMVRYNYSTNSWQPLP
jgi:branched-chain amino acid transport system substrate-binding protein